MTNLAELIRKGREQGLIPHAIADVALDLRLQYVLFLDGAIQVLTETTDKDAIFQSYVKHKSDYPNSHVVVMQRRIDSDDAWVPCPEFRDY